MKSVIILVLIIALFGCEKQTPEEAMIEEMSTQRGYSNWFLGTYRCGLFVPESYDPQNEYPLIIYLHGYSDTTTWDLPWYNEPIVSSDPCIVMTPKCPTEETEGWGNSFRSGISPMMQRTYEMLELVEEAFNLDYSRFYIYGTSMGGYGTYGVIRDNPDMFAAAYVQCGNGNTAMASILVEIPLWIFHGSEDQSVPVQGARDMYQAVLNAGGTQIRYTEYEGVGHNVWDYTRNETTLRPWLLAQRKGVTHGIPDSVTEFKADITGQAAVFLEWNMPTDLTNPDNQIWYCKLYRDGAIIEEIYNNHTNYTDNTVVAGETYVYQISAVNYFFKESVLSSGISLVIQ
jgi:poly(3-hydroxybutyrate) depolymerase